MKSSGSALWKLLIKISFDIEFSGEGEGFEPPDETCYGAGDDFVLGKATYIHWVLSGGGKSQILHLYSGNAAINKQP